MKVRECGRKFATTRAQSHTFPRHANVKLTSMHCTLLIPDLLPPHELGSEPYAGLRLAHLGTILARGNTARHPPVTREDWLCERYGVPRQQDLPLAALMLKADGGGPANPYWLCADPIQLRVDRNRLIIAGRATDFSDGETRDLMAALNQHFAADGIVFCAPTPARWYLRCQRVPQLVTTPLARALNRSIKHHLPQGGDALAWHRVMNEAQMILHNHPVTAAREARGAAAANSIWLWGGGALPVIAQSHYTATWGGDHLTRAFAIAASIAHHDLPADGTAWLATATAGYHLLELDAPANALHAGDVTNWRTQIEALDEQWINPLLAALRARKIDTLTLTACNSENLLAATAAAADMRRFWRRARPLAAYAGLA